MSDAPAPKMIFVNLPVKDLSASIAFYEAVGALRNKDFASEDSQMLSFSDAIHVMLLTHERFASFTPRRIPNAHETAQVLLAISEQSRDAVDVTTDAALGAGGTEPNPQQDHGFMYGRSFADLDGHIWEVTWMDVEAALATHRQKADA